LIYKYLKFENFLTARDFFFRIHQKPNPKHQKSSQKKIFSALKKYFQNQ